MDLFSLLPVTLAASGLWQGIKNFFIMLLEWLYQLTVNMGAPNWVLAIFMFTLIVKILTQPLQNKQLRATRRMQLLAPEVEALKKRYANNPQKMQAEQMRLYKENKCSPTAGCLPLLVQMPIIIALFQALRGYVPADLAHYSFMWISDLSQPDPTWILPIVSGVATLAQQWLTTANKQDKTQKMMMWMMPLMFVWFVRSFPALLAFYWIFYSIIGALITYPLLKMWEKKDKAAIISARAAKEEEADERRRKKAAAREAARARNKQQKKAAYSGDYIEEEEDLTDDYPEDDDEDEEKPVDPEVAFRAWLKQKSIQVKKKKMRLHPWSSEDEIVELGVYPNGREADLDVLRQQYKLYLQQEQQRQQLEASSLGNLLSKVGKRKNKEEKPSPYHQDGEDK